MAGYRVWYNSNLLALIYSFDPTYHNKLREITKIFCEKQEDIQTNINKLISKYHLINYSSDNIIAFFTFLIRKISPFSQYKLFNIIKKCTCCSQHMHYRPKYICIFITLPPKENYVKEAVFDNKNCNCRCRHITRDLQYAFNKKYMRRFKQLLF